MEELNSCWARGRGGFAWIRLVKCRKVHKETLVLVHSIGFTEVKQSTVLSNKPKDSDRKGTAASCGAADVSLRCRLNTTGPPTSTISPMHPCESSTLSCGRLLCVRFMCLSLEWRRVEAVDSLGDWQKSRRLQEKVEKVETSLQKVRLMWGGKQQLCFRWERLD